MPLFLSTFINKVDRKGRVSVPAGFRAALTAGEWAGVVLYRSPLLPAIVGADLAYMERHSAEVDELMSLSDPRQALSASILADSRQLAFDPEGRISLPADLMAHAGITEQAAFVGRGKTFQIWEPKALEDYNNKALAMVRSNLAQGGLLAGGGA
jgi:MraZ protein